MSSVCSRMWRRICASIAPPRPIRPARLRIVPAEEGIVGGNSAIALDPEGLALPFVQGLDMRPYLTVAAAEAAIGLAILVVFYRNRGSIAVEDVNVMKG